MFLRKRSTRRPKLNDLSAFIDEGAEIDGKLTFTGTVMLNSRLRGEIVTSDTLIVGEKGAVHATIHAGVVVIHGEVVGSVLASERVELRGSARVHGDVEAPVVVVEEGVLFEGRCHMTKGQTPEVEDGSPAAARDRAVVSLTR